MTIPSFNNQYALLALFLSPWKDEETVDGLANIIQQGNVDWGRLLYMANLHFCAPLWFVRLQEDGLLPMLPSDLQSYLQHLHQANAERQDTFRLAAVEIVSHLQDLEVPVILLKGAATFCDDLYEDAGARMMGDLDFLVKTQHIEPVKNLLWQLGYDELAGWYWQFLRLLRLKRTSSFTPLLETGNARGSGNPFSNRPGAGRQSAAHRRILGTQRNNCVGRTESLCADANLPIAA